MIWERTCKGCGTAYTATAPGQKYCKVCQAKRARTYSTRVGCGSGKSQGFGPTHHSWKNGTGIFRRLAQERIDQVNGRCERCGKDLRDEIGSSNASYAVHHRDHNHLHNDVSNLELLCKSCHQREHDCEANLPNPRKV